MRSSLAASVLLGLGLLLCGGCASDPKPVGPPESEHSDMPWNPPMPGEGSGAFGGVLNR